MIRIQTKHYFKLPSQNIHGQLRSGCQWTVNFLESQFDSHWHILLQALHLFSDAQRVLCLSLLTSFHHCLNPLILEQEDTGIHPASTDILEHNVECLHMPNCWHVFSGGADKTRLILKWIILLLYFKCIHISVIERIANPVTATQFSSTKSSSGSRHLNAQKISRQIKNKK